MSDDPWADPSRQFAYLQWTPKTGELVAKCKFVVEGRRCNAKFNDPSKLYKHLLTMHRFAINIARRFSERKKENGK